MAKYLLVYRGGSEPAPEQAEGVMAAWMGWFGTLGASVVDGGAPTAASKSISSDGSVSDGAASAVTGWSVLDASSFDDAVAKAKGCPHLLSGGHVDVYETIDMGGM